MIDQFALWTNSPDVKDTWLLAMMCVLILPVVLIGIWYYIAIRKSDGGRRLMREQWSSPNTHNIAYGIRLMRDIADGDYGPHARAVQRTLYWLCGLYVLAAVFFTAPLLYGEHLLKGVGG